MIEVNVWPFRLFYVYVYGCLCVCSLAASFSQNKKKRWTFREDLIHLVFVNVALPDSDSWESSAAYEINADECWTDWVAGVLAGGERRLSRLTGRLAWFALRCMRQPFASVPSSTLSGLLVAFFQRGGGCWLEPMVEAADTLNQKSTWWVLMVALLSQNFSFVFGCHYIFSDICSYVFGVSLYENRLFLFSVTLIFWILLIWSCPLQAFTYFKNNHNWTNISTFPIK